MKVKGFGCRGPTVPNTNKARIFLLVVLFFKMIMTALCVRCEGLRVYSEICIDV